MNYKNCISIAQSAMLLASPLTYAQLMLEEVVVTAQKRDELLTEAPLTVNVIGAQRMEDFAVFQADELGKLTAGLDIRFSGPNTGVGVRGVGTFSQQAAPARVGTYLDNFYLASGASIALGALFDMDSVQLLRGPQGALYSMPSPTGGLILETANPDLVDMTGYFRGSLVDPSGHNLQGAVSVPLIDGELAVRVAGFVDDRKSGVDNIVRDENDETDREGYRVKLLWEPMDALSVAMGYHSIETTDSGLQATLETFDESLANYQVDADDRNALADAPSLIKKREEELMTLNADWSADTWQASWWMGALESRTDSVVDNDLYDEPIQVLYQRSKVGRGGDDSLQTELRVSGLAFDRWSWVVGGYYASMESGTSVLVDRAVSPVSVIQLSLDIPTESETSALFTHNTIDLSDNTTLTIGLRYNKFELDTSSTIDGDFLVGSTLLPGGVVTDPVAVSSGVVPCVDGTLSPCNLGYEHSETEWTGTIKLAHSFNEALNIYGTIDRGYRPGGPNFDTTGIYQPTPTDPGSDLNVYQGESVDSLEFGLKGRLFGGKARYTSALFYSVYEDYQTQVGLVAYNAATGTVDTAVAQPFINVDEAVQAGVDAELTWLLTDNWSLFASFTYANVEFTEGEVICTDADAALGPDMRFSTCDADGEHASTQPEWFGTLQGEYVFPQLVAGADAYVSGLMVYRGDSQSPGDTTGRFDTDDFVTLDVYAGLRQTQWDMQLFVKNLADEDGVLEKSAVGNIYNKLVMTPPRTYGVTVGYRF